jgi:hypothetical protein
LVWEKDAQGQRYAQRFLSPLSARKLYSDDAGYCKSADFAGALLKQFDGRGRPKKNNVTDGVNKKTSQRDAVAQAGMSKQQQDRAVDVNNIPRDDFEQLVEGDDPPTIAASASLPPISERARRRFAPRTCQAQRRPIRDGMRREQLPGCA